MIKRHALSLITEFKSSSYVHALTDNLSRLIDMPPRKRKNHAALTAAEGSSPKRNKILIGEEAEVKKFQVILNQ